MSERQNDNQIQNQQTVSVAQESEGSEGVSLAAPGYSLANSNAAATTSNPVLGSAHDRQMSVQHEMIAHGFAYTTSLNDTQGTLAQAMGFQKQWFKTTGDAENERTGFFAGLLLPKDISNDEFSLDGPQINLTDAPNPVLAFRGSESGDQAMLDFYHNDMDPIAVGYTAFHSNIENIHALLSEAVQLTGKRVVVTGHSLGGSLAKQAALQFPQFISACYSYQAPGISAEQQAYLEENMNSQGNIFGTQMSEEDRETLNGFSDIDSHGFDDIRFEAHTGEGDLVNYAGGGRIPTGANSSRIKHDPSGITGLTPIAHTAFLTSSPEFAAEHAALNSRMAALDPSNAGTTDSLYSAAQGNDTGATIIDIDNPARNTDDTVHESIEALRDGLIAEMFNPHSKFINEFPERIPAMPLGARITILRSLLNGPGVIESLTTGAGVGFGIAAFIKSPLTVLGMAGGALAGFSEYGGDSTAGTIASTTGGAALGGGVGAMADGLTNLIPGVVPLKAIAAPVLGVVGGLAYAYFAISTDINETQEAALKMLTYSPGGDQKEMISGIGGATIFYHKMDTIMNDLFGSDVFERTREEMTQPGSYFSQLNATEGADEIRDNLNGGFLGFGDDTQEKIIADVLVHGVVGNQILTELGDGDYDEGLKIVLKKLQGREDRDVSAKYSFRDASRGWFW